MEKADISETHFSIKNVRAVIRAENKMHNKKNFVNGRPCDVFVYIISGKCEYACDDGTEFTVNSGDVMFLAKGEKYSICSKEENYRFIFCDFEFNEDVPRKSAVFTPKNDSSVEKLFIKLLNVFNAQNKTCFTDSLSLIYSIYSAIISTRSDYYVKKSLKMKITDAKEYIDRHYNDSSLGVFELAKAVDMSDVYFRKYFKAELGVSPAKYIISVRLKKAKELMIYYPFLSLDECAKQSGFSSLQYFSRVFTKEFGIVPSKYRIAKK